MILIDFDDVVNRRIETNQMSLLVAKLPNSTGKLRHEVIFTFLSPKIPDLRSGR